MWHNYVTVALRTLYRNPVFSAINILGPAVGMAARLLGMSSDVVTHDRVQYREAHFYFADQSVLAVFHLPFVKGC